MPDAAGTIGAGFNLQGSELANILNKYNEVTLRLKESHDTLQNEVRRLREELEAKNMQLERRKRLPRQFPLEPQFRKRGKGFRGTWQRQRTNQSLFSKLAQRHKIPQPIHRRDAGDCQQDRRHQADFSTYWKPASSNFLRRGFVVHVEGFRNGSDLAQ